MRRPGAHGRELVAWGVDGICTNVPDVVRAALDVSAEGRAGPDELDRVGDVVELEAVGLAEVVAVDLVRERRRRCSITRRRRSVLHVEVLASASRRRRAARRRASRGSRAALIVRNVIGDEAAVEAWRRADRSSGRLPRYVYGLVLSTIVK